MYVRYQKHIDAKYDTIFRTVHIMYIYKVITFQPIIGEKVLRYNFEEEGKSAFFKLRFLLYKDYHNLIAKNNYKLANKFIITNTIFMDESEKIISSIKLEKELYDKDVIITYRRQDNESHADFLNRTMEHAKNASTN